MCFIGGHHITLEDSEIYETGNNAISLNYGNTDYFVFRRNHIHHTGLSTSGPTEGEGFYAGCNNDTCRTTNSLFEGNYIHHLRGTSDGGNDGIEIKVGSYNNVVRNNVIHDTTIGRRYPCIFVYGGGSGLNIVEGNVVWNCGEAIQVVSDAVIRNNIVLNSDVGITAAPHIQVAQMRNVTIANNTLYGHGQCLYARWDSATSMTVANNAMFCPGATAVDASGLGGSSITVRANYVEGGLAGASLNQSQFFSGGTAATAFTDPQTRDFWPRATGSLVGKSDAAFTPANDVNERPRGAPADVGAYEANGLASNPGWRIVPGFKQTPLRRGGVRRSTGPSLVVAVASFRSHQCAAGWSPPALPAGASAARRSAWTWRRRFRTRARRGGSRPRGSGLRPRRRLGGFVSQQHSLSARALGVLRTTLRRRRRPTPPRSLEGLEGGERAIEFRIDGLLVAEPSLGSWVIRQREPRLLGLQREGFCSLDVGLAIHEVCAGFVERRHEAAPSRLLLRLVA